MLRYAIAAGLVTTLASADPAHKLFVKAIDPKQGDVDGGTYVKITGRMHTTEEGRTILLHDENGSVVDANALKAHAKTLLDAHEVTSGH
jgi:hypothetical protein